MMLSICLTIFLMKLSIIYCQSCDFQIYRYDDSESIAAAAGYSLVTVTQIKSGTIHDDFVAFMATNDNAIKALGTWETGYDCLYYGSCTIATSSNTDCSSVRTWTAGATYYLCPWNGRTTIDQGLQDLSGTPFDETIAVYMKCGSPIPALTPAPTVFETSGDCDFQIYRYNDSESIASSAGYSLVTVNQIKSGTLHDKFISFVSATNNTIQALGTFSTLHDCFYIGSTCSIATSDTSDCVAVQEWTAGDIYYLCPWSGRDSIDIGLQDVSTYGIFDDTIAVYVRCTPSEPTPAPNIVPSPTSVPSAADVCDFEIYRYDDLDSIASKAGYSLVSVSDIQSGGIHDYFISFMSLGSNTIKALGSFSTSHDCLYIGSTCSIATSDTSDGVALQTWTAGDTYYLCPWGGSESIDDGLQKLSGLPVNDTIAIYMNCGPDVPTVTDSNLPLIIKSKTSLIMILVIVIATLMVVLCVGLCGFMWYCRRVKKVYKQNLEIIADEGIEGGNIENVHPDHMSVGEGVVHNNDDSIRAPMVTASVYMR